MLRQAAVASFGLVLITVASGTAAQAQGPETARDCATSPAPLPPELAPWPSRIPAQAARDKNGLTRATLVIGQPVDATLVSTPDVRYVARPEKPGGSVSYGGLFAFTVGEAGNYRVALGSAAWVDVLTGERPVTSSAHGHGPQCSGIRKMVDFPLRPGRYVLQISANGEPGLPLMVIRLR